MSTQPSLTLEQYEMIFKIVYSVVTPVTNEPFIHCFYINSLAGEIMINHHNLVPELTSGFFTVLLDKTQFSYGKPGKNNLDLSDAQNYHAWLQLDDWVIDFMAPLYGGLLLGQGHTPSFGPKMFQKKLTDKIDPKNGFINSGDYYFIQNDALTQELINHYRDELYKVMLNICVSWYNPDYSLIKPIFEFTNSKGLTGSINMQNQNIVGAW